MAIGMGAATIGGALIGAAGSYFSGKSAADFAERSYKHRYQWQVKDMQKAGLNPMLSVSQGAPNVPQPNFPNIGEAAVEGFSKGASVVTAKRLAAAQETNLSTASAKNLADADKAKAEADQIRGVASAKMGAETAEIQQRTAAIKQNMELVTENINAAKTENEQRAEMLRLERDLKAASAAAARSGTDMRSFAVELAKVGVGVLKGIQSPTVREEAGAMLKDTVNMIEDKGSPFWDYVKDHVKNAPRYLHEWGKARESH